MALVTLPFPQVRKRYDKFRASSPSDRWLLLFLLFQFVTQGALVLESLGGVRIYFRILAFTSSLAMLVVLPVGNARPHPFVRAVIAMLAIMAAGMLHSDTDFFAGLGQWWLTLAIWAPVFWVGRLRITPYTLWKMLWLLWLFNAASSVMGVLQVYDPGRFAPSPEFVKHLSGLDAEALRITLVNGQQIFRPFGFSDSAGGASAAGSFAIICSFAILTISRSPVLRITAACSIIIGLFCIYVCEVRAILIFTAISLAVTTCVQFLQGRMSRAFTTIALVPVLIAVALGWSMMVSGERVVNRITSLTDGSVSTVYYKNRGKFVEQSLLKDLPKYPLGAGLGRYGQMYSYFGNKKRHDARPLYAEIQLSAWLYDGGLLLVALGYGIMIYACYMSLRIALFKHMNRMVSDGAALVAGLNVGWLAISFSYPLFVSQTGITFCLLNGVLYAAFTSICSNSNRARTQQTVPAQSAK